MAAIEELAAHPTVIHAARVAKMFQIDPVAVLRDGGDELVNMVRTAAAMVVSRDEEKEAEKARSQSRRRR